MGFVAADQDGSVSYWKGYNGRVLSNLNTIPYPLDEGFYVGFDSRGKTDLSIRYSESGVVFQAVV